MSLVTTTYKVRRFTLHENIDSRLELDHFFTPSVSQVHDSFSFEDLFHLLAEGVISFRNFPLKVNCELVKVYGVRQDSVPVFRYNYGVVVAVDFCVN